MVQGVPELDGVNQGSAGDIIRVVPVKSFSCDQKRGGCPAVMINPDAGYNAALA